MGKENTQSVGEQNNGADGTGTKSTSTRNTGNRTGGRGANGRTKPPGGETTESDKNVPKLVNVDIPGQGTEQAEKKPRGRPPGSKSTTNKPKTTRKANTKTDSQHIKILMLTVSGIIASRENMQMWALTPQEIDSLAEPLAAVLDKHNVGQATGEYAEYIALVMALFVVFVPKYLMWKEINKQRKVEQQNARKPITNQQQRNTNENGATTANSQQPSGASANDGASFSGKLHDSIPAII